MKDDEKTIYREKYRGMWTDSSATWGRNIRYALATVIVFWTFVEIMARNGFFNEIWVDPMNHIREMTIILAVFVIVVVLTIFSSKYITTE